MEILEKILLIDRSSITPDLRREDIEDWDSMTHLVLISDIEEEFGVSFSDEQIAEVMSVADLITLISS